MTTKKTYLSFCIPVYNEENLIKPSCVKISQKLKRIINGKKFEIIYIENGSTDKTLKELKKIKKSYVRFATIKSKAHGLALKKAISESRGEYVFLTAIDLPFGFGDLAKMIKIAEDFDLIFGSKGHPNSVINKSFSRKISSIVFNLILKILFRLKIKDTQGSIFLNKKTIIPFLKNCDSTDAFFSAQLAIYATKASLRITEIPVKMRIELGGRKSKYNILNDGKDMILSAIREYNK